MKPELRKFEAVYEVAAGSAGARLVALLEDSADTSAIVRGNGQRFIVHRLVRVKPAPIEPLEIPQQDCEEALTILRSILFCEEAQLGDWLERGRELFRKIDHDQPRRKQPAETKG